MERQEAGVELGLNSSWRLSKNGGDKQALLLGITMRLVVARH